METIEYDDEYDDEIPDCDPPRRELREARLADLLHAAGLLREADVRQERQHVWAKPRALVNPTPILVNDTWYLHEEVCLRCGSHQWWAEDIDGERVDWAQYEPHVHVSWLMTALCLGPPLL